MRLINGIQCYCRGNWNRQDKGSLKAKITLEYFQNNAQDPVFQVGKKKLKKEKKRKKEDFLVNIKMIKIKDCKKNISVSDIGICLTLGFRSGWIFFLTPSSQTQEKHCAQKLMIILHGPIEVNSIVSQHRGKQSQVFYWLNSSAGRWISLQNLFRLPISTRLDRRLLVAN